MSCPAEVPAEEELPAYGELVQINVGGTTFETYLSTLTRFGDSVLSIMVASRRRNEKEFFVDRNPKHLAKVLGYLRDSENFTAPLNEGIREELRKEAEMCSPEVFRVGDRVQWKESAVELYCKFLITYWLPKERFFRCPVDSSYAKCRYIGNKPGYTVFFEIYVYFLHAKQHMSLVRAQWHILRGAVGKMGNSSSFVCITLSEKVAGSNDPIFFSPDFCSYR